MYYKVMKNGRVIDVLDQLIYVKWSPKLCCMTRTNESYAQGFLSSDKSTIWHADQFLQLPVTGYDTVDLVEIDEYEYKQLKTLSYKTPEDIIDAFVLSLFDEGFFEEG